MTDTGGWSSIRYLPIGRIRTPFPEPAGTPVQSASAFGSAGHIELDPELVEGLRDLEAFSHLILLYHLHRSPTARLTVTPFLDVRSHGVFATRSPARPNRSASRSSGWSGSRALGSTSRTSTLSTAPRCSISSPMSRPSMPAMMCG